MNKTTLFASFLFFNLCFTQIGGIDQPNYDELSKHKENIYLTCKYSHEFGEIKDGSSSKIKPMKKEITIKQIEEYINV